MKTKKIVMIDSGVGGVHILAECTKLLPYEDFVYIADTFNAPYGEKRKKQLIKIVDDLVREVIKQYNPNIIVLGCNTLTVNTINFLRKKYGKSINFVGVEPALKQAKIYGGNTLVLATPSTIKFYHHLNKKITRELKQEYAQQKLQFSNDDKVTKLAVPNLAKQIDDNIESLDNIKNEIQNIFANENFEDIQNIVLGCTHYIAVQDIIQNEFGNSVQIFNGSFAVAKRVQSLCKKNNKKTNGEISFISTDGNKNFENKLKNYLKSIK